MRNPKISALVLLSMASSLVFVHCDSLKDSPSAEDAGGSAGSGSPPGDAADPDASGSTEGGAPADGSVSDDASRDGSVDGDAPESADAEADTATDLSVPEYFLARFALALDSIRWGEFHAHSTYSIDANLCGQTSPEGTLGPAEAYAYARDDEQLDFVGLSDHAEQPNPLARPLAHKAQDLSVWESVIQTSIEANNEDPSQGKVFIVFVGWEYTNTYGLDGSDAQGYGHKNVLFKSLDPSSLPQERISSSNATGVYAPTAAELYSELEDYRPGCAGCSSTAFTIVHTPANAYESNGQPNAGDHRVDWDVVDPDFVRHVEIASKWGASEGPQPLHCTGEDPEFEYVSNPEADPLAIRATLHQRWVEQGNEAFALAFVGGTDAHNGRPGNDAVPVCGMEHRGAVTGILAPELTRESLWDGLWSRHTLASQTGLPRFGILMALETETEHLLMGDIGQSSSQARVRAVADVAAQRLDLIVDGCFERSVDGNELDAIIHLGPGRHYVYVRAATGTASPDGERRAWSTPVYLRGS
jgi:hypothetical protein